MPAFWAAEVEIDRAEEVAVVGERDGREPELLGLLDELLELGGAVEQAVLGVDVQMDELACAASSSRSTPTRSWTAAWTRRRRPPG